MSDLAATGAATPCSTAGSTRAAALSAHLPNWLARRRFGPWVKLRIVAGVRARRVPQAGPARGANVVDLDARRAAA